jgi:hypothetical protein
VRVLPGWVGESWQVWLAFTGRKHVPRKVQAFVAFLKSEFGDPELDPWQGLIRARPGDMTARSVRVAPGMAAR